MASIRQRSGKWQARVRRKGYPDEVASFKALTWARSIESAMDQGSHQSTQSAKDILLADILQRYMNEVTPSKRGAQREAEGIQFMLRQRIASYSMANLTPSVIAGYRDDRMKTVGAGTIIRELSILSGIISHARKEWSLPTANPCALVRKPPTPPGRTRLLSTEEEARLLHELQPVRRRSPWMVPLVMLALESAMRRGELLALRWENINLATQTAFLPLTKNGTSRTVPLSKKAVAILEGLPNCGEEGPVFPISFIEIFLRNFNFRKPALIYLARPADTCQRGARTSRQDVHLLNLRRGMNMTVDVYLSIEGVKGESADSQHQGCIECLSVHWKASQPRSPVASTAGGHTVGRVEFEDVTFVKHADLSSPILMQLCASGKTLPKATFQFYRADGSGQRVKYYEIVLTNVLIGHVEADLHPGDILSEHVGLKFSKAAYRYTQQKIGGGAGGSTVGSWNLATNTIE